MLKAKDITPEQAEKLQNYIYEIKYDGLRAFWDGRHILSERGINQSDKFPHIADALNPYSDVILDGEICLLSHEHTYTVHDINKRENWHKAVYVVFDLLKKREKSYEYVPFYIRRERLCDFIGEVYLDSVKEAIQFQQFKDGWDFVLKNNLEGLIAKDLQSRYHLVVNTADLLKQHRVRSWLKIKWWKSGNEQIIGFNEGNVKGSFILANGSKISALSRKWVEEYLQLRDKDLDVICEFDYLYKTREGNYFQPRLKRLVGVKKDKKDDFLENLKKDVVEVGVTEDEIETQLKLNRWW